MGLTWGLIEHYPAGPGLNCAWAGRASDLSVLALARIGAMGGLGIINVATDAVLDDGLLVVVVDTLAEWYDAVSG